MAGFRSKAIFVAISAALFMVMTGCRSSRHAQGSGVEASGSPKERMAELSQSYSANPLKSFSIPVSLEITSPAKAKISGNMYIVPSKYIFFSARFLGIEVGTVMITPDSVFGKIKPGKMYLAEPVAALKEFLPVNLDQIQELLAGRVVIPGYTAITKDAISSCRYTTDADFWTVTPTRLPSGLGMTYIMTASDNSISSLKADINENASAVMVMNGFASTSLGYFPASVGIEASKGDKKYGLQIEYNVSRLRTEIPADKTWSVPRGYTRVSPAQVIKALGNL